MKGLIITCCMIFLGIMSFAQEKTITKHINSFDLFASSAANIGKEEYNLNLGLNYYITEAIDVRLQGHKDYFSGGFVLNPMGKDKLYPSVGVLTGYDHDNFLLEIPLSLNCRFSKGLLLSAFYQRTKEIVLSSSKTNYFGLSIGWHFDL